MISKAEIIEKDISDSDSSVHNKDDTTLDSFPESPKKARKKKDSHDKEPKSHIEDDDTKDSIDFKEKKRKVGSNNDRKYLLTNITLFSLD